MKEAVTWTALAVIIFIAPAQQNAAAPQATISPPAPNKRLCSISGSVTDVATNQGLTRAYLRLTGKAGSYAAVTDERARFVFEAVEPGTYLLEAEHQGYIDGGFGDTDGPAVEIKLTAAQTLSDIFVRLPPQAVISGRVVNEDGDPWTHAHVNLFRSQWSRGHPKIEGFDSGSANDEGEFRIGQLPPGKYYLAAEPDAGWEIRNRPSGKDVLSRQATWYPNSLDLDGAASIIVGPGSHISGLEIRLRRGSTHRIRGTLLGSDNISIDESHGPFGGRSIFAEKTSVAAVNGRAGAINSDGSFEIAEVPSGIYEIRVRQGLPPIGLGTIKVQVEDRDVDDVSIQLIPPRPVKGMIQIEEQGSMKPAGLTIRLESFGPSWGPSTVSRADGGFDFPQVGSERYRVIVSGNSGNGFYLKQIRYGDAVSNDETISLTGVGGGLATEYPRGPVDGENGEPAYG